MNLNIVDQENRRGSGWLWLRTPVAFSFLLLLILSAIIASGCEEEGLEPNSSGEGSMLKLEETYYDFGTVPVGQKVEHDFTITNTGSGTLKLGEVDVKLLEGC